MNTYEWDGESYVPRIESEESLPEVQHQWDDELRPEEWLGEAVARHQGRVQGRGHGGRYWGGYWGGHCRRG